MLLLSAPLHCLRKTEAFQTLLSSRFNRPALYQLGYDHGVAIRPLTHASILWKRAKLEPGLRTLINKSCRKLNSISKGSYFLDVGANVVAAGPNDATPVYAPGLWSFGTPNRPRYFGAEVQLKF